jgi:apolipoprotein N-acyltransferase
MADHILSHGDVPPGEPSVAQTFDLAQRVAIDRLRLLQLDLETRVKQVALRTAWMGFGTLCLLLAWLGVLGAAVFALAERMPPSSSLLLVAGSQLLLGGVLIAWGRRRGRT